MAKKKKRNKLAPRRLDETEVASARAAMVNLSKAANTVINRNKATVQNIFGSGGVALPSYQAISQMAGNTRSFIELALVGSRSLKLIHRVSREVNKLANPDIDRFAASEIIGGILVLIGGQYVKVTKRIGYGILVGRQQDHGYDGIVAGTQAMTNAGAIQAFAAVLPPDFRKVCLATAKEMGRVRKLAREQKRMADEIQAEMAAAFDQDLLPGYARTIKENAKKIPILQNQRIAERTRIGKEATKDQPDENIKESTLIGITNALINAMVAMREAQESWFLRSESLIASSEAAVGARSIEQATGGKALRHMDQLGFMLIVQFIRMIVLSLLALAKALGEADAKAIENFWASAAEEDKLTEALTRTQF